MTNHTSTKTITPGTRVRLVSKGRVLGGGEVVAIDGRDILIAQEVDVVIGADCAADTFDRAELVLDRYTLSRSVVAWDVAA